MTEPASPRRMTKGERTRERILDSAAELFSRQGFRAVSLRDIAAQAKITHAGLLHHFPGKDEVLIQVLERRDAIDAAQLFDEHADSAARLREIVGFVARNMRTPGLVDLYVKISGEATAADHPAHHYFTRRYQILRELAGRAFADLWRDATPSTPTPDPTVAAGQFLALMDGLQVQWLYEPDAVDMRASVVAFLRTLGIDAGEPPTHEEGNDESR